MINKIKDLFNATKYRIKYNTVQNAYDALRNKKLEEIDTIEKNIKSCKNSLKFLKENLDELTKRVADLETKRKK